jgi:hypothetical protein
MRTEHFCSLAASRNRKVFSLRCWPVCIEAGIQITGGMNTLGLEISTENPMMRIFPTIQMLTAYFPRVWRVYRTYQILLIDIRTGKPQRDVYIIVRRIANTLKAGG